MSDELPTAARVSDPGIRALYRLENRWQAWLDVEAALAKAQEELAIIPNGAAEAIGRAAHLDLLDRARIDEGFARTGHTIVPLVWELSRVTGEPHEWPLSSDHRSETRFSSNCVAVAMATTLSIANNGGGGGGSVQEPGA